jgi:hypothetical protein
MESNELQPDIVSLESLLKSKLEKFDQVLKKNMNLDEVRTLFHELRVLKSRVDEFYGQKFMDG